MLISGLVLLMLPFVRYAFVFGAEGLGLGELRDSYLFRDGGGLSNPAIFGHMLCGAVVTLLVPVQLIPWVRRLLPWWHRWAGRIITGLGLMTGAAGLLYILQRGSVGGWPMDLGFGIYGLCLIVSCVQTLRFARAGQMDRHRRWALRTFWLAIGSWLYRFHYGLWYLATDGAASNANFSGAFDLVQNFAFYLPYLLGLELYLRR
ncbi:MAG: DUF2306 domain-containing protein [Rhodobacterales bacterium]|uniref:DUF2306 domain-containing protein n=1 Tax=Puniceibacterium antarcticum TaxID=1206336 RepID=UPI001FE2C723|nr:DUF2306 domain-containing protein [Puniceibacterium antarcticum]